MAELEPQFSSDDATPTPWAEARECLEKAEVYWLSTVRSDGRPHVILTGRSVCLVLRHRPGRTQSEEPRAQLALRHHDRA